VVIDGARCNRAAACQHAVMLDWTGEQWEAIRRRRSESRVRSAVALLTFNCA